MEEGHGLTTRIRYRTRSGAAGAKEVFRTKCGLAVALLGGRARIAGGPHLGIFDGGYAPRNVVRPLVMPEDDSPRVEFLTRLRHDARLHRLPPEGRKKWQRGPTPNWGKKLSPPRQGGRWPGPKGEAFLYGRMRKARWEEVVSLWRVPGLDEEAGRADQPGAVGDDEPAAAVAVPVGCRGQYGLVVGPAVGQEEGPSEHAGRGSAAEATPAGNPAPPVGAAGR